MQNTWPGGVRKALSQTEHERWNRANYPGTRQLCFVCDEPTGQCEEDAWWDSDGNTVCRECYGKDGE